MVGRNFTDDGLFSLHWNNPAGPDVLRCTSTAGGVREALVALAYAVRTSPRPAIGLCSIAESRLSGARLRTELDRFRAVVSPRSRRQPDRPMSKPACGDSSSRSNRTMSSQWW